MKSAKLLRAELEHRNAGDSIILRMLAKVSDERLMAHYAENRERDLELHRRKSAGMASLIGMLIVCGLVLVLAAAMLPNVFRAIQTREAEAAANTLSRISYAENSFSNLWGPAYTAPASLTVVANTSSNPNGLTCANPQLLVGQDAQPQGVEGYTIQFKAGSSATANPTCSSVNLFQSYTLTAQPSIVNGRWFFLSSADGVLRFNDGAPATIASPIYPIAQAQQSTSTVIYANTNGGTTTPACPTGDTGTYPNCVSPPPPSTVTNTAPVAIDQWGDTFWSSINFGGNTMLAPTQATGGNYPDSSPPTLAIVHNFSVVLSKPSVTNLVVELIDLSAIAGGPTQAPNVDCTCAGSIYLDVPAGATSAGSAPYSGGFTLDPSHSYTVRWTNGGGQSWSGNVTLTIE